MRKKLLAKIHIGKADVGMSEEEWRALILKVSKNRSSSTKELKNYELEEILNHLKGLGFHPLSTYKSSPEPEQSAKLRNELERLQKILRLHDNYIKEVSKNLFQITNLEWLQDWQLKRLIKILESKKLKAVNEGVFL